MLLTLVATGAFHRAIELNPRDYRPFYILGITEKEKGRVPEAIQLVKKYKPLMRGKVESAVLSRAVELKKDDDQLWTLLGSLFADSTFLLEDVASRCLLKAVELGDSDGGATKALVQSPPP